MNDTITELHVRAIGKKRYLQAFGRTGRGTKFLVSERELVTDLSDSKSLQAEFDKSLLEIVAERDAAR